MCVSMESMDGCIYKTASESIDSNLPTFLRWNDMLSEACFIYHMKDMISTTCMRNNTGYHIFNAPLFFSHTCT